MTSQQAQEYIRKYQEVLADDEKLGGRRSPSLLPTTKENILTAIKLEIAQLHFINSATEERVQPMIRAAMFIDSFTSDALDTVGLIEDMQRRRHEIQDFMSELVNIGRSNPFYWQRIYSLIGVSLETKSQTFFDTLKAKLGLGQKPAEDTGQTAFFRRSSDRIVLD